MLQNFNYYVPVRIVFGPGKLQEAGEHVKQYGNKALIVTTGPFFKQSGLVDRLQDILKKSGVASEYFPEVSPNPLSTEVDKGAKFAQDTGCDVFVGLGGGSAMDGAKCIAYAVGHNEPIWPHWIGQKPLGTHTKPIIAITTTSGTASHISPWAVITNPETKEKPGNGNDSLFAKVGIVDPELMLSLPKAVTAMTTFDVLAHALEGYTSNLATPITDMFCEHAIRMVGTYGRKVAANGQDLEARTAMAYADTLAGFSLSIAIVTLAHAMAHCVGGIGGASHGGALSALTPRTMRFSMNARPEKFKQIGLFLRDEPKDQPGWTPEDSVREVEQFIKDIGAPRTLSEQGIKETDLEAIVKDTLRVTVGNAKLDARMATQEDMLEILKQSL
jgi:alcohol dehydrogenase